MSAIVDTDWPSLAYQHFCLSVLPQVLCMEGEGLACLSELVLCVRYLFGMKLQ